MTPITTARPPGDDISSARSDVPVVLLHGQPGSPEDWRRVMPLLEGHTVLAPKRPGYDGTLPGGFFHNARWLLDLLDQHGFARAVIAGHSWGGGGALAAASLAPERVAALALIGSVGTRGACSALDQLLAVRPVGNTVGRLAHRFGPSLFGWFVSAHGITLNADELSAWRDSLFLGSAWSAWLVEQRALIDESPMLEERLPAITVPVVMVNATRDVVVPPRVGRDLACALPHAVVREVDAGHLMPMEVPQVVAAAIREAVALVPPQRAAISSGGDSAGW